MFDNQIAVLSSFSWASPSLLVDWHHGFYYHKVGKITKAVSYPLPHMEDYVDLVGPTHFASLIYGRALTGASDFLSMWNICLCYQLLYSNQSPATFQRLMNLVVAGLEGCTIYLDDVVVFWDIWTDHIQCIDALFSCLAKDTPHHRPWLILVWRLDRVWPVDAKV